MIGVRTYSIYRPFFVIEAKRLPTPGAGREREYVTGVAPASGSPTGGIQRFKLGLHDSNVEVAAMVGYIQDRSPDHWHKSINRWIDDLTTVSGTVGCVWVQADKLRPLQINDDSRTAFSVSIHQRCSECATSEIRIHHLWVIMDPASVR